ncbi:hypothetical protein MAA8898_04819 [Maliponia aquimaris]|uniref:Uncharacterized protein n=2 Tax=Maliponia aquimaris TaxID=1673631 RepID=A0A238L872_9RHOB|nr:hypothetical protein MAA8898_04819 [Maliponia aquimaris]
MSMRDLLPNMRSLSLRLSAGWPETAMADPEAKPRRPITRVPPLRPPIEIPVADPGPDAERAAELRARGQFLARQEDWERLAQEMLQADRARARTPGLRSVADLLSQGARSDFADAIALALGSGNMAEVAAVLGSVDALRDDMPDCPAIAHVAAMTYVDAASACRAAGGTPDGDQTLRKARARYLAAAAALNDLFDPFEWDSPLWAAVRCALVEADAKPRDRVADDYEDLIDLDPGNPHHLRSFGNDLRPTRFGDWEVLDRQARRTAARTADVWGVGGYAWVYFGALGRDKAALRRLDAELFVEGLHDILTRHRTQDMANRLAALTGYTLGGVATGGGALHRLADCLGWIAQDHLRELHPVIWAEAAPPITGSIALAEDADPWRRGRARALSSLAAYYAPALEAGRRLVFTDDGLRMVRHD